MRIRVPSRSLKMPATRRPMLTFHAVFRYVPHALGRTAVVIRQAVVRGQVRGHLANQRRPHSHLPTTSCRTQRPTVSAKLAADSLAASLGYFVAAATSALAIPAAPRSGRRARNQIYGRCDAARIATAKMRLLLSPRAGGSSLGVPRMTPHRLHHPQRHRSSESSTDGRRREIRAGSAMAPQLEVGMRVRDLPRNVLLYKMDRLVLHAAPSLHQRTHAHRPRCRWARQSCRPRDHQRQHLQNPARNRRQICV